MSFSFVLFFALPNKCCNKNFSVAICKKKKEKKTLVKAGLKHGAPKCYAKAAQVLQLNIYQKKKNVLFILFQL